MKKKFSTKWKASRQVRKQRKYRANAPLHIKQKFLRANLNKELRKKYGKRSISVRKGDVVRVMRGKMKGKKGKINEVDFIRGKISIEGLQITKKDGTKINVYFNPSNLQIQELSLDDKKRIKSLEKKKNKGEKKNASEKKQNR